MNVCCAFGIRLEARLLQRLFQHVHAVQLSCFKWQRYSGPLHVTVLTCRVQCELVGEHFVGQEVLKRVLCLREESNVHLRTLEDMKLGESTC